MVPRPAASVSTSAKLELFLNWSIYSFWTLHTCPCLSLVSCSFAQGSPHEWLGSSFDVYLPSSAMPARQASLQSDTSACLRANGSSQKEIRMDGSAVHLMFTCHPRPCQHCKLASKATQVHASERMAHRRKRSAWMARQFI